MNTFVYIFLATSFATVNANSDAKRLYDDLMSSYNSLIRPVANNSDTLIVKMALKLSQLVDVVSFQDHLKTMNWTGNSVRQ